MNQYYSKLDSERFGYKVFKINSFPTGNLQEFIQGLKNEGVKLVISRLNINELKLINELEREGFELKDVQLTQGFQLENYEPIAIKNQFAEIRDFQASDLPEIEKIAATAFATYGHYFADEKLKQHTPEIYKDWARNSCLNKQLVDIIIVATIGEQPVGFLSLKINDNVAIGGMGAVAIKHQNKGLFKSINLKAMNWAKEMACKSIEHNVLANNLPVNAAYSKLGFQIQKSEVTLHGWI
tara:strand:- start:347 stop:1063 length:717 start_codon:yes stop_codon:yes gene_type:complete